jgi:hypothetical protein
MSNKRVLSVALAASLLIAAAAVGQADSGVPFFSSAATAYDGQVATFEAGMVLSGRSTPSGGRIYTKLPLGGGYVGSGGGSSFGSAVGAGGAVAILDRPGMTLVAALQP